MRVVRYDRFEGVDQLWIEQVHVPEAAPGRVVVRVLSSRINPGSLSALNGSSYVPLRDLAGEVVGVGPGVEQVVIGDEVLGWAQDWAAHAEFVAVPAEQLVAKPRDLSWDVAGSLYVTPMAGLAGVTAAQLARRSGADVIGVSVLPAWAGWTPMGWCR